MVIKLQSTKVKSLSTVNVLTAIDAAPPAKALLAAVAGAADETTAEAVVVVADVVVRLLREVKVPEPPEKTKAVGTTPEEKRAK